MNVLVYAHREDAESHPAYRDWLSAALQAPEPVGISELVLSGFVRVTTHPRVFADPSPLAVALDFADGLRNAPNAVAVAPGRRHWLIFCELCRDADATGNIVPDAYLAALAIESGGEWITTDRDYSRFRGLRWRHPLAD
ncbi:MAG: type II toxin-antitoxin system VapC family toxin [Gaiellaceae bacterium]